MSMQKEGGPGPSEGILICRRDVSFGKGGPAPVPQSGKKMLHLSSKLFKDEYSSEKTIVIPQSSHHRPLLHTLLHRRGTELLLQSRCTPPPQRERTPARPPS